MIAKNSNGSCKPLFSIKIRYDDLSILNSIAKNLGIGKVYSNLPSQFIAGHKQAKYQIGSLAECLKLVAILDSHPLQSKKNRDYQVWREAVLYMNEHGFAMDDYLAGLRDKIKSVRKYSEVITG
jgi:hypothetical protein